MNNDELPIRTDDLEDASDFEITKVTKSDLCDGLCDVICKRGRSVHDTEFVPIGGWGKWHLET